MTKLSQPDAFLRILHSAVKNLAIAVGYRHCDACGRSKLMSCSFSKRVLKSFFDFENL